MALHGPCTYSNEEQQSEENFGNSQWKSFNYQSVYLHQNGSEKGQFQNQTNKILTKNIQECETAFGTPFDAC